MVQLLWMVRKAQTVMTVWTSPSRRPLVDAQTPVRAEALKPFHRNVVRVLVLHSFFLMAQRLLDGEEIGQTSTEGSASSQKEHASLLVLYVSKKDNGLWIYNKIQYCLFCQKEIQKIARHLERKHSNEIEVAKALSFPKKSKERRMLLDYIRKRGKFTHNTEVFMSGKGELVPCKLPQNEARGEEFLHCLYCHGLFKKSVMWRHIRICKFKPENMKSKPGKSRVQTLCSFAEPAPSGFCEEYWKFLSNMNHDQISLAVKQDSCILEYGSRLFQKYWLIILFFVWMTDIHTYEKRIGKKPRLMKNLPPCNCYIYYQSWCRDKITKLLAYNTETNLKHD